MLSETVVTFSDGKLELPKQVQEKMHLQEGTRLKLLSASPLELRFAAHESPTPVPVSDDDWRSLRGILEGHPEHDTSKARAEERAWEREHDERKFGPFSKI